MEEIFCHIRMTDYKSLRQVSVYFKQVVQLFIDCLEFDCEQRIEMRRQAILHMVFEQVLPRQLSYAPAPWPSIEAWSQQTIIPFTGDYR
jgi:hypothetical protein